MSLLNYRKQKSSHQQRFELLSAVSAQSDQRCFTIDAIKHRIRISMIDEKSIYETLWTVILERYKENAIKRKTLWVEF